MPNHIENRLEIIGTKVQVNKVLNFLRGEPYDDGSERFIDFNKIIPMPEELDIISDGWVMPLKNSSATDIKFKEHIDKLREIYKKNPVAEQKTVDNFIAGIKNYIKYGHTTWYSWRIENWGTKWNAYQQEMPEENIIMFETAWDGIPDLVNTLSYKFPNVSFLYKWSDEDTGANCGSGSYKNGEIELDIPEDYSKEAYKLAFELWPECEESYKLVGDRYEYVDEEE